MQKDQTYSDITNLISTRSDIELINSELDLLENSIYETKGKTFDYVLKNSISKSLSELMLSFVAEKDKEEVIQKLRDEISKIKIVEITLSIDPSQKLTDKISNFIKESIDQKVAIDIKVDPSIIAGLKIIFEGKYYDGSLKNKLDKINYV